MRSGQRRRRLVSEKIIRKITMEIYEMGYHTQTHETGLYEHNKFGEKVIDPFKDCKNTVMVRETMLSTKEGVSYLRSAFSDNSSEFIIVKVNKRGTNKFIVDRETYRKVSRRKFD